MIGHLSFYFMTVFDSATAPAVQSDCHRHSFGLSFIICHLSFVIVNVIVNGHIEYRSTFMIVNCFVVSKFMMVLGSSSSAIATDTTTIVFVTYHLSFFIEPL